MSSCARIDVLLPPKELGQIGRNHLMLPPLGFEPETSWLWIIYGCIYKISAKELGYLAKLVLQKHIRVELNGCLCDLWVCLNMQ